MKDTYRIKITDTTKKVYKFLLGSTAKKCSMSEALENIEYDGENIVATDGRSFVRIKSSGIQTPDEKGIYSIEFGKNDIFLTKLPDEVKFPSWKQFFDIKITSAISDNSSDIEKLHFFAAKDLGLFIRREVFDKAFPSGEFDANVSSGSNFCFINGSFKTQTNKDIEFASIALPAINN